MSRDFFMGVQKFTFVEEVTDEWGKRRKVYRFECAICRGQATVALPRGAVSSYARRCRKHRLPSAMIGSKVEAVVIAALGWDVAKGSVLDEMREEGSAWIVSSLKLTQPVLTRRDSEVAGSVLAPNEEAPIFKLSPKERAILTALSSAGGLDVTTIGEATDTAVASARVLMSRLLAKRFVVNERDGWRRTQRGEDALADTDTPVAPPVFVSTLIESDREETRAIGLFD